MSWFQTPKSLQNLVEKEVKKCADWGHSTTGVFWLALRVPVNPKTPGDREALVKSAKANPALLPLPSMLIIKSEAGKEIDKAYIELAGKSVKEREREVVITGNFTRDAKAKTFTFWYDDKSAPAWKVVDDDIVLPNYLQLALWGFMPGDCKSVYMHGRKAPPKLTDAAIDKPPDGSKELTTWSARRLIRTVAALSKKDGGLEMAPPAQFAADKGKPEAFLSKIEDSSWPFQNIKLPSCDVTPSVQGQIINFIGSDPLLMQFLYDAGWEAAKAEVQKLKIIEKLAAIDSKLTESPPLAPKAASELVQKEVAAFATALNASASKAVVKAWEDYSTANKQYLRYQIKAGFKMAANVAGFTISLTTTVLAGWTGVGTVFGAIGLTKTAIGIARDAYKLCLTAEQFAARLTKQLKDMKKSVDESSAGEVGAKEVAASAVNRVLGTEFGTLKVIKTDAGQLKEKALKGFTKAQDLSKGTDKVLGVYALLDETKKAQTELQNACALALENTKKNLTGYNLPPLPPVAQLDPTKPGAAPMTKGIYETLDKLVKPADREGGGSPLWKAREDWRLIWRLQVDMNVAFSRVNTLLESIGDLMAKLGAQRDLAKSVEDFVDKAEKEKVGGFAKVLRDYAVPLLDFVFLDPMTGAVRKAADVASDATRQAVLSAIELSMNGSGELVNVAQEKGWINESTNYYLSWAADQTTGGSSLGSTIQSMIKK